MNTTGYGGYFPTDQNCNYNSPVQGISDQHSSRKYFSHNKVKFVKKKKYTAVYLYIILHIKGSVKPSLYRI